MAAKKNTKRPTAPASGYQAGKSKPAQKSYAVLEVAPKPGTARAMSNGVNRGAGTNARNAGVARTQAANVSGAKKTAPKNSTPSRKPASGYQAGRGMTARPTATMLSPMTRSKKK